MRTVISKIFTFKEDIHFSEVAESRPAKQCYHCGSDPECFLKHQYSRYRMIEEGTLTKWDYTDLHFAPQTWYFLMTILKIRIAESTNILHHEYLNTFFKFIQLCLLL